jgi:hypothetical protein
VALNTKDDSPITLPEKVIIDSIQYFKIVDYSKLFSLVIDFIAAYHDLLRPDIFISESKEISSREKRILSGLLELANKRRFNQAILKISKSFDHNDQPINIGSQGRINSFGLDPIMAKYGILCSTINRIRSDKKVLSRIELMELCEFFKWRIIIGPNARADYLSLRKIRNDLTAAKTRQLARATKSSSVYFEQVAKVLNNAS